MSLENQFLRSAATGSCCKVTRHRCRVLTSIGPDALTISSIDESSAYTQRKVGYARSQQKHYDSRASDGWSLGKTSRYDAVLEHAHVTATSPVIHVVAVQTNHQSINRVTTSRASQKTRLLLEINCLRPATKVRETRSRVLKCDNDSASNQLAVVPAKDTACAAVCATAHDDNALNIRRVSVQ